MPYLTIDVLNMGKPEYANVDKGIFTNGEVLMVMDGAASSTVYQGYTGVVGSTLAMLKIKDTRFSNESLFSVLKAIEDDIKKRNTGSTVPHANKDWILEYLLPVDFEVLDKFKKIILTYRKQINENLKQNQELYELKDWLLPMLMNGQVTFK